MTLSGFKSFADKTTLKFSPGISAVVGPNGCGKSNIVDAIRWVLGEQSAKSMRGMKMQDLIFSGTTKRPALNLAEVTLTFTDVSGVLPTDFDELAVTRRVYRSGESEYLINQRPVRLKDLHDLFLNSGMGKNAFSVFEQGKIDQIIQFSPYERRYIFEEAAGISRFLQRKKEALRKLEESESNLLRVRDIFQEVEAHIIILEKQAEKALSYKENKELLDSLEKRLGVVKWLQALKRREILLNDEKTLRYKLEEYQKHDQHSDLQTQELKQKLASKETALSQINQELYKFRSELEIHKRGKKSNEERYRELISKEQRLSNEQTEIVVKSEKYAAEVTVLKEQQKLAAEAAEYWQRQLEKEKAVLVQQDEAFIELQSTYQQSQELLSKLKQQKQKLENEVKQYTFRQDHLIQRRFSLSEKHQMVLQQTQEFSALATAKQMELDGVRQALDSQKSALAELETRTTTLLNQISNIQKELKAHHQKKSEVNARHHVLTRLKEEYEGYSVGSKRILQEADSKNSPLFGIVKSIADYIVPTPESEIALASTLKAYAQTLVVNTTQHLRQLIDFANQKKLKDFSILCLEMIPTNYHANPLPWCLERNQVSDHFLSTIVAKESLEEAMPFTDQLGKLNIYSEGIVIDKNGVFFCYTQIENSSFKREAEMKGLELQLDQLENEIAKIEAIKNQMQASVERLQLEKTVLEKNYLKNEISKVETSLGLQQVQKDLDKAKSESSRLETELHSFEQDLITINTNSAELTVSLNALLSKESVLEQTLQQQKEAFTSRQSSLRSSQDSLRTLESQYRDKLDDHRKTVHQLHLIDVRIQENALRQRRVEDEINESKDLIILLQKLNSEAENQIKEIEATTSQLSNNENQLKQDLNQFKQAFDEEESKAGNRRKQRREVEDELNRLVIKKEQLLQFFDHLQTEFKDKHQISIEEHHAAIVPPGSQIDLSIDPLEKQIRILRPKVEAIEGINMAAISECQTQKVRYQFLKEQVTDLENGKMELVKIIAELDGESRKLFTDTFQLIRANFQKNFQLLFNGGEADLQFCENGNILEAGIEIVAKPPGKQMRSLSLLSGGEKCLTAMALLFSIFEVKSAPFCILDEIDAPLDETNVDRFMRMVKQFADRSQFIIITHNKSSMAMADVLCGVSMQERGVSKLLSIQFADEKEKQLLFDANLVQV